MIRVNYISLDNATTSIGTCNTVMTDEIDTLRVKLGGLRDVWEGDARLAYDECMQRWDQAALAIKDVLSDTSARVADCRQLMAQTESGLARTFRG
jgi:WXG100 family type VII secretion target